MAEKEKFEQLYIKEIIKNKGAMSDELNTLFDYLLVNEFGDDPERMSTFIQTIIDENTEQEPSELEKLQRENEELKSRIDMNESTILELSDMVLGGM